MTTGTEPKPKAEKVLVFVWKSRHRGFLMVAAKNVEAAREIVAANHPTWMNRVAREPDAIMKPEAGQSAYVKQRVVS